MTKKEMKLRNLIQYYQSAAAKKAAEFVNVCDAFNIPVLSITNVTGYATCKCAEKGIAKAAAQLTYAFANATVPKVNVITEKAYGSAYTAMNSKSLGADIVYAWTDAKIGMMDANSAVKLFMQMKLKHQMTVQNLFVRKLLSTKLRIQA